MQPMGSPSLIMVPAYLALDRNLSANQLQILIAYFGCRNELGELKTASVDEISALTSLPTASVRRGIIDLAAKEWLIVSGGKNRRPLYKAALPVSAQPSNRELDLTVPAAAGDAGNKPPARLDITRFAKYPISEGMIKHYIEHRRVIRNPLTQYSLDQQIQNALKAPDIGLTPDELIADTIERGWRRINAEYTAKQLAKENGDQLSKNASSVEKAIDQRHSPPPLIKTKETSTSDSKNADAVNVAIKKRTGRKP